MALQLNIAQSGNAPAHPQAYAKAGNIRVWKDDGQKGAAQFRAEFAVDTFADKQLRDSRRVPLSHKLYKTVIDPVKLIYDQVYAFLKTLPDFAGATDV